MASLTDTNAHVHANVTEIHHLSTAVAGQMDNCEQRTTDLTKSTEAVQELVSRFKIGSGAFDQLVNETRVFRDRIQAELEQMEAARIEVFDRNYQAVPGSNPPKFKLRWGDEFTRRCQRMLDESMERARGSVFAVAVNTDGYLSAHNARYSKPLTGDPEKDLVGNRTCRKFENPSELRAARNTQPMLLQTYLRDTGEVLCDLAMPIMIGGRHWGNVRVGMPAEALIER
jgi:methyl-accepting chemotaxis protein